MAHSLLNLSRPSVSNTLLRNISASLRDKFQRHRILGSIVVSIPACHAGDRGSIPRRGDLFLDT